MTCRALLALVMVWGSTAAYAANPGTVTDLSAASVLDTAIELRWTDTDNGLGGPSEYTMRVNTPTLRWGDVDDISVGTCQAPILGRAIGQERRCTITGLRPNTPYQVQMVAFRGTLNVNAVFSGMSNKISVTTPPSTPTGTVPGKVLGLTLTAFLTARLHWEANTEPDLAGYKVYMGTASKVYGAPITLGKVTTFTTAKLTSGRRYFFAITAYDTANNESGFSNEVSTLVP
jgi:hypothetical protein